MKRPPSLDKRLGWQIKRFQAMLDGLHLGNVADRELFSSACRMKVRLYSADPRNRANIARRIVCDAERMKVTRDDLLNFSLFTDR